LKRKGRKEHEERKRSSLHGLCNFPFAFFAIFAVQLPASEEKSSGAFGIMSLGMAQPVDNFAVQLPTS
jgi:hypothetical protein